MVFYVYMRPEVVAEAQAGGPYAIQSLIGILRGFLQNCCIAEFDDYRDSLKTAVNALPEDFNRTELKSVLGKLAKLHRFIYCLEADYMSGNSDAEQALEQSEDCLLDLLLLDADLQDRNAPENAEICCLSNYQVTEFERARSKIGSDGSTYAPGQCDENDFLDEVFLKAISNAAGDIEICDCILGERFGDNFEYTMKMFLRWLETILKDPDACSLVIHCGTPKKATPEHIKTQLAAFRGGRIANMAIEIQYYGDQDGKSKMPHERFILTDQFALHIERGMDFLDKAMHKNRDAFISMKSRAETVRLLEAYKGMRTTAETI